MTSQLVNILMVEDNIGDARLVEEYLVEGLRNQYRLTHCDRLCEALSYLNRESCDVILLDLSLPDSRGLSTFIDIHGKANDIPIVILTGLNDETLASQAIQSGAKDFLPKKDLDGTQLARTIRYAIERQQWEATLRQGEERISRLEKLEAIGRLSAGIAHNFNNILTAIIGNCELLTSNTLDPQALRRAEAILKAAKRASSLTRELMAFCRKQPMHPTVFQINEVLRDMEHLLAGAISKDITFTYDLHPHAGHILSDPAQVEQIVLNLVLNARDAMPTGGPITIRTMPVDLATPAEGLPDCVPPGAYVALTVNDTGAGMDSSIISHVFEPFFTTKDESQGNGLGLATVYGIVSQNKGYIHLVSQLGAGTTFTIYLPRQKKPEREPVHTPKTNLINHRGSETILLVEDEREVCNLLAEALREDGYKVLTARDGIEALTVFTQHANAIHLVVSDINMPHMDGNELTRRIKALKPTVSVILMTGYAKESLADLGEGHLVATVLVKPFTPHALSGAVRETLNASNVAHPTTG